MTEVNETQIGGEHYQSNFQHWDLVEMLRLPYLEACATKYILRHRKKNGRQDLEKALHFVQKILENEKGEPFGPRPGILTLNHLVETKFYRENRVDTNEMCLLRILFSNAPTNDELMYCVEVLQQMIAEYGGPALDLTKPGPSWNDLTDPTKEIFTVDKNLEGTVTLEQLRESNQRCMDEANREDALMFNNSGFGEPAEIDES